MNIAVLSLHELSLMIKKQLETEFSDIYVRGEVVQPKKHTSGHVYFTIKDKDNILDCIAWKTVKLELELQDGQDVICYGKISSYAGRSKYQMIVSNISYTGIGAMMQAIEERKKRLQIEGLFDRSKKPLLPKFPQSIGIITSRTGAVIHDMIHRLNDRYPCNVILYPVSVQGSAMVSEVLDAIEYFHQNLVDIIILARGGGSFEDLFHFNDESLVRRIAYTKIPIVTAIGHETDTTLVDYASTLRAPTPTAAIELITPDKNALLQVINNYHNIVTKQFKSKLEFCKKIVRFDFSFEIKSILQFSMQKYDYCIEKIYLNTINYITKIKQKCARFAIVQPPIDRFKTKFILVRPSHDVILKLLSDKRKIVLNLSNLLSVLSYTSILNRGFCRAFNLQHGLINTKEKALLAHTFETEFADGSVLVEVKED